MFEMNWTEGITVRLDPPDKKGSKKTDKPEVEETKEEGGSKK